jgi:hypothetical protein
MSDFQIRKIIYGMLQAGLVELVQPEGFVPPSAKPSAAPGAPPVKPMAPAVKRSVVVKLIDFFKKR